MIDAAGIDSGARRPAAGRLARLLVVSGTAWSVLGFLDPRLALQPWWGVLAALLGTLIAIRRGAPGSGLILAGALACLSATASSAVPSFGGDSASYYVYLRSAFFDHDLDFANEWSHWGYPAAPATATGLRRNIHAPGSALLWSPFYAGAHGYVLAIRALGRLEYEADGFDPPYTRAAALGTLVVACLGGYSLFGTLAARFGSGLAGLGLAGALLGSPLPYYLFVQPVMAHGIVFGVACWFLSAWIQAEAAPSLAAWLKLGFLLGLISLVRWQAVVSAGMLLPLALVGLRRRTLAPAWLLAAALLSVATFAPQFLVWKILFGNAFAIPYRQHGMDWSSPHLLDVLVSADRGLFTWTPLLAVGTLGLMALLRRWPSFATGALLVLAATAWVNGGVKDWAGADAYGARRFDLVLPLLTFGVAVVAQWTATIAARRPWLVPAAALLAAGLWNLGLMRLYRIGIFTEAAPFERIAAGQARQAYKGAELLLGALLGERGRGLAYDLFVGEYLYHNVALDGTIDVGAVESRFLSAGWSPARRHAGWPAFRWAFHPRACFRAPLQAPLDLRVSVTARAPSGLESQTLALVANGHFVQQAPLATDWSSVSFVVPAEYLAHGPNNLCLEFSQRLPGEAGVAVAAAVSRIQLP